MGGGSLVWRRPCHRSLCSPSTADSHSDPAWHYLAGLFSGHPRPLQTQEQSLQRTYGRPQRRVPSLARRAHVITLARSASKGTPRSNSPLRKLRRPEQGAQRRRFRQTGSRLPEQRCAWSGLRAWHYLAGLFSGHPRPLQTQEQSLQRTYSRPQGRVPSLARRAQCEGAEFTHTSPQRQQGNTTLSTHHCESYGRPEQGSQRRRFRRTRFRLPEQRCAWSGLRAWHYLAGLFSGHPRPLQTQEQSLQRTYGRPQRRVPSLARRAHVITLARSASKGTPRSNSPLRKLRRPEQGSQRRRFRRTKLPPAGTALRLVRPTCSATTQQGSEFPRDQAGIIGLAWAALPVVRGWGRLVVKIRSFLVDAGRECVL